MSTATLEAPKTEPIKVEPNPKQAEQDTFVRSLLKPATTQDPVGKQPKVEIAKVQIAEQGKTEPTLVAKVEQKPADDKEKNWAELRSAREASDKRAAELEARLKVREEEFETFKKNPVPKEWEEKLTAAEKRAQQYDEQLKVEALARHPDFQRKYNDQIRGAMESMGTAAMQMGLEAAEVRTAIGAWDETKFGEWIEGMPPAQKLRFESAYHRAIELDHQRQTELKNASESWENLQKQQHAEHETNQKRFQQSLIEDRNAVLGELMEKQETFKSDATLQKETEALLDSAAGLSGDKMTTRQILANLANSHVLNRDFQRVTKEKETMAAELETVRKTLAERDEFIKSLNGAVPNINPTISKSAGAADESFLKSLIRPSVRA